MNYSDLKKALGIGDKIIALKQIMISADSLTENINDLLKYCYDNASIIIDDASVTGEDEAARKLTLQGTSKFLNVDKLPLTAVFSIDAKDQVQLLLKYTLIEGMPETNSWNFSRSFPNLPKLSDDSQDIEFDRATGRGEVAEVAPIRQLYLSDAYYVVVSSPQQEPEFDVPLAWGINFVSHLKPQGVLAIIESLFKHTDQLTIYGTIRKPIASETPQQLRSRYPASLQRNVYPWDIADEFDHGLPGILLKADLGIDYTIAEGKIEFALEQLLFYTPCDTDWTLYNTNPFFAPVQAYTGKMRLPGTDIEMDMRVPIYWGLDELVLLSTFQGLKLEKLAQLVGLTGADHDPLDTLPSDIRSMASKLGELELTQASLIVDYGLMESIDISYASFTVGMPELNWAVWKDDIVIDNIFCRFEIYYPFHTVADTYEEREYIVTVFGKTEIEGVPFEIYAASQDGFTVNANMLQGQTIPLNTIMKKYAPRIPSPGNLTVDTFRLTIAPRTAYSMSLCMASHPKPWVIPVGPHNILVENVVVGFTLARLGGSIAGTIAGQIEFGDFAELDIVYDIPGSIQIRSLLPEIHLQQIIDTLTDHRVPLPKGFNLTFRNSSILFREDGNDYVFQLVTEMDGFGYVGLQVQRVGSKWGIAFGLDMVSGLPSGLPGLGILATFEKLFTLEKFMLVVSSFEAPQFQFPDLSSMQNPLINAKKISLPSHGTQLLAGFNLYALWSLDPQNKQHQLLKKFLGLDPSLGVTIQVGEDPAEHTRLYVDLNTTIQGHPFDCQFGGVMESGELGLFLTGSFTVNIQKQPQTFDVVLLFVENGAFLSADMTGPTAINFGSFQLADLALEIGIDWEGIPSLGVAATLDVANFESSIAIFFDSADPAKSLVAGAVSDLSAKDVVDTLVGKAAASPIDPVLKNISIKGTHHFQIPASLASDLDHLVFEGVSAAFQANGGISIPSGNSQLHLITASKGSAWFITDLTNMRHYQLKKNGDNIDVSIEAQLYCAPQNTSIGAVIFPQGFYLNAAIAFLGFHADATIDISVNKGIAIDAEMDKVVIGNANLFALTAEKGKGGPKVSASTFKQPKHPVKEFRPPHFYINGSLTMLGLNEAIFVELTTKGFEFELKGNLIPGMNFDLNGMFAGPQHLSVGGDIKVGLGTINLGAIGKLRLNTDADAALNISVHGDIIAASAQADFEALGKKHHIASFDLDVSEKAIAKLAKTLEKKAEQAVTNTAKDLLRDIEKAQKKVDDLKNQIGRMRKKVKAEHAASVKKFNAAKKKVDAAQKKVDSLKKQISSANAKIRDLKSAIARKKSWAKHGNVFKRAKRGVEYAAFAASKGSEITGLYAEIGTLTSAKKAADAALTLAKQPLVGLKKAAQAIPVDSDPRVAGLIAAKESASVALAAAKAPLKALV